MGGYGSTRWGGIATRRAVTEVPRLHVNQVPKDARAVEVSWGGRCYGVVHITTTRPNYGGLRRWWCCPGCRRRTTTLYAVAAGLLCRRCGNLCYPRQRHDYRQYARLAAMLAAPEWAVRSLDPGTREYAWLALPHPRLAGSRSKRQALRMLDRLGGAG